MAADSDARTSAAATMPREVVEVTALVMSVPEPFLIPDVTPPGWSKSVVFHIVRDLVDAGALTHKADGYRRVEVEG